MSLRWSKLKNLPSCSSGEIWYVCESGSKFVGCCTSNPCFEGCLDENIPHAASPVYQNGGRRTELLRKREQKLAETTTIFPSNPTATDTVVAELPSSTAVTSTTATVLPSASQAPSSAASHRSRIALIAGTSGGGFLVALLIGVILFFWLHTRKSRKEHQLTFERRISEPGMIQKPLVRHSIAAQSTSPHHSLQLGTDSCQHRPATPVLNAQHLTHDLFPGEHLSFLLHHLLRSLFAKRPICPPRRTTHGLSKHPPTPTPG